MDGIKYLKIYVIFLAKNSNNAKKDNQQEDTYICTETA